MLAVSGNVTDFHSGRRGVSAVQLAQALTLVFWTLVRISTRTRAIVIEDFSWFTYVNAGAGTVPQSRARSLPSTV
jgi:hypothetical protein